MKNEAVNFPQLDGGQYDSVDPALVPANGWARLSNILSFNQRPTVRGGTVRFTKDMLMPHPTDLVAAIPAPNLRGGLVGEFTDEWALVAAARSSGFYLASKLGKWVRLIPSSVGGAILDDEMPWVMEVLSRYVYAVRRNGGGMKSIDADNWALAGRPKPATAPADSPPGPGGGSLLPGSTYQLAYSYFDSTLGYYGPRSDAVSLTGSTDYNVDGFTAPPGAYRADRLYIWATLENGSRFFLLDDIPAASTDYDFTALPTGEEYSPRHEPPPVDATWWTTWLQRSWWVRGSSLAYSLVNRFESYSPVQEYTFDPEDGADLVVAYPWGNTLVTAKPRKMWLFFGYDRQTWEKKDWTDKVGCVAPHSMKDAEGRLIWKGEDGFYGAQKGGDPQNLTTDTVREYLKGEDTLRRDLSVAEVIPEWGIYFCTIPLQGGRWGGVAYNWREGAWTTLEFPRFPLFVVRAGDPAGASKVYATARAGQHVYELFEGNTDEGREIQASMLSRAPQVAEPGRLAGMKNVYLLCAKTRWPVTLRVYGDQRLEAPIRTVTVRLEDDAAWKLVNISTLRDLRSQLQLEIIYNGRDEFWLSQMSWDVLTKMAHRRER